MATTSNITPPVVRASLKERCSSPSINIDGRNIPIRIIHHVTGKEVEVSAEFMNRIKIPFEEAINALKDAAKESKSHKNFTGEHIEKISVDLSSAPHEIKYHSKVGLDGKELSGSQHFFINMSTTNKQVHEFAMSKFSAIAKEVGQSRGVASADHIPAKPTQEPSRDSSDRTVSGTRTVPDVVELVPEDPEPVGDTLSRLKDASQLLTEDLVHYTKECLAKKDPDIQYLITVPDQLTLASDGKTIKLFGTLTPEDLQKIQGFREDPSHPFIIYVHHHPHVEYFSVIVAKDGKLYAYDPKGVPISNHDVDLKAVYSNIYGKTADPIDIHEYSPDLETIQIMNTVFSGLGSQLDNTTVRTRLWEGLHNERASGADFEQLVWTAVLSTFDVPSDVETTVGKAIQDEITAMKAEGRVISDAEKAARIVRAAAIASGKTPPNLDVLQKTFLPDDPAPLINQAEDQFRHQRGTDNTNCGPLSLQFVKGMMAGANYHEYVSTPISRSVDFPALVRQQLAKDLTPAPIPTIDLSSSRALVPSRVAPTTYRFTPEFASRMYRWMNPSPRMDLSDSTTIPELPIGVMAPDGNFLRTAMGLQMSTDDPDRTEGAIQLASQVRWYQRLCGVKAMYFLMFVVSTLSVYAATNPEAQEYAEAYLNEVMSFFH